MSKPLLDQFDEQRPSTWEWLYRLDKWKYHPVLILLFSMAEGLIFEFFWMEMPPLPFSIFTTLVFTLIAGVGNTLVGGFSTLFIILVSSTRDREEMELVKPWTMGSIVSLFTLIGFVIYTLIQ